MTLSHAGHVAHAAADALIGVDPTGGITFWNQAATRLLGFSAGRALGETLALIIPPEHRAAHVAGFHRAMESGSLHTQGAPVVVTVTRADGSTVEAEMTLGILQDGSGHAGAVAALRPVGEHPRLDALAAAGAPEGD